MTQENSFALDTESVFCNDTGRIMTGENLQYLIAFLNSNLILFAFRYYYSGGGLGGKGIRFKHTFMENIPIPPITSSNRHLAEKIETLVSQILTVKKADPQADTTALEAEIDSLVYELYGLTEEEIKIVEESVR